MSNSRNNIIKDVENLMIKVLKDSIPERDNLSKNHTLKKTNLTILKKKDLVNIEFDILGKYIKNFIKKK